MTKKTLRDIYTGVNKNDPDRRENDFYPTPPLATYVLCKYSDVPHKVVEPCAGRGNISIELIRNGHDVLSYDLNEYPDCFVPIETGHDALTLAQPEGYTAYVTNPPYHKDLPRKILEKALENYEYIAFFVRLTFLEGMKRYKVFKENPPTQIIFLSDRIRFIKGLETEPITKQEQIDGMIAYAWVIFEKNPKHEDTKLNWVMLRDEYDEWLGTYSKWNESK